MSVRRMPDVATPLHKSAPPIRNCTYALFREAGVDFSHDISHMALAIDALLKKFAVRKDVPPALAEFIRDRVQPVVCHVGRKFLRLKYFFYNRTYWVRISQRDLLVEA